VDLYWGVPEIRVPGLFSATAVCLGIFVCGGGGGEGCGSTLKFETNGMLTTCKKPKKKTVSSPDRTDDSVTIDPRNRCNYPTTSSDS